MSQIIRFLSHAKVNLGLCLLGKRDDGFHELETLMHEVRLADEITLVEASRTSLMVNGQPWDESLGQNLMIRAKQLCENILGHSCGEWLIDVKKRIPMGSGMGGGSSNAIVFLNYLQSLWPEQLNAEVVDGLAASLGSDTNFFIHGGSAICRGRGEKVDRLENRLFYFNLLFPDFSCSTPLVFSRVEPNFEPALNWQQIWSEDFLEKTRNDLEAACCEAYPEMRTCLNELRSLIPQLCLSGSGSTMFTVSASKNESDELYRKIRQLGFEKLRLLQTQSYFRV